MSMELSIQNCKNKLAKPIQVSFKCIEVFDSESQQQVRLALFPADRAVREHAADFGVQVQSRDFSIRHPRQSVSIPENSLPESGQKDLQFSPLRRRNSLFINRGT